MNLILSKIKKGAFAVFKSFHNKYVKGNSIKSYLLTRSDNVLHGGSTQ